MFCPFTDRTDKGAGQLPCKGSQDLRIGADTASFFYFPGRTPNLLTPTVMRRHREDIFHTTCTACKDLDRRDPSIPLRSTRDDSFRCHPEWSTFRCEVETSRPIGACTFTNHTRSAQIAETNINDRSRCSIIPRLERGMPAVDGFVTYHSTFSSLDGGAFHPLRAILHTIGRHARSGHAVLSARFHDGRPLNGFHSISFSSSTAHSIRSCRPASFHSGPRRHRKSAGLLFVLVGIRRTSVRRKAA